MPIKWTPENDQILLLKILETCNVTANVKGISEAWPTDRERPTPRAISERLFKIRSTTKNSNGTATLTVSNGSKRSTPKSSPQKPTSSGKGAAAKGATATNGSAVEGKRKRNANTRSFEDNMSDDSEALAFKVSDSDTEDGDSTLASAKKAKTTKAIAKVVPKAEAGSFAKVGHSNPFAPIKLEDSDEENDAQEEEDLSNAI